MGNGCEGCAQGGDTVANASGAGTLALRLVAGPRMDASAVAEALERDPHTIGRWAAAFGEGGPAALIFEQTGGSPPALGEAEQAVLKGAVQELPGAVGMGLANWNWRVVHQFVADRFGISLNRSSCLNYPRLHEGRLCTDWGLLSSVPRSGC